MPEVNGTASKSAPLPLKAVIWDFGGVITTSPFDAFNAYERAHGLRDGFLRGINATNPDTNAWAAYERGEVDIDGFAERFEAEALSAGGTVDARAVVGLLRGQIRPEMVEAVRRCQERLKTGLITNNFIVAGGMVDYGSALDYFDVVIESSKAGFRKPDPRVYRRACDLLGIEPGRRRDPRRSRHQPEAGPGHGHADDQSRRPGHRPRRSRVGGRIPVALTARVDEAAPSASQGPLQDVGLFEVVHGMAPGRR